MSQTGIIIVVEDDPDDIEVYEMIFEEFNLKDRLLIFKTGELALEYLRKMTVSPFLIICDINLPTMTGMELRAIITADESLCKKSIPFVFMTTSASRREIEMAYEETVQGYFVKSDSYPAFRQQVKSLLDYWSICFHPNMF
jgi:CheY-like chemotaxis protein